MNKKFDKILDNLYKNSTGFKESIIDYLVSIDNERKIIYSLKHRNKKCTCYVCTDNVIAYSTFKSFYNDIEDIRVFNKIQISFNEDLAEQLVLKSCIILSKEILEEIIKQKQRI